MPIAVAARPKAAADLVANEDSSAWPSLYKEWNTFIHSMASGYDADKK